MLLIPILTRLDSLTGGGNKAEDLVNYAEAIIDTYPDRSGDDFERCIRYGIRNVDVYGKLTFMTLAKFMREWWENEGKPYNPRA